ncbi:MAG: hypothetical protein NTV34_05160, partial [Proteobacteria bacterium]|nr:hypothetical protein [Pseudomonadota bacterium]
MKISALVTFTLFVSIANVSLAASTADQRKDCKRMAIKAARLLSDFNDDNRKIVSVTTSEDTEVSQNLEITFDEEVRGASITYSVIVERNPSPIVSNQTCMRIAKIE